VAVQLAAHRRNRDQAIDWADRMVAVAEQEPGNLILVAAEMVRANPTLAPAFVAELTRRLQGHGLAASVPMVWLEQRLAEQGHSVEQIVQQETQSQAADQVSIGNSIGSLRFLAAMDWREFVETLSVVEQTLRDDPANAYADMDFATRDSYRHAVERIARHSPRSEEQVAQKAVELAGQRVGKNDGDIRTYHVGYYLIDKGHHMLERAVGLRLSPRILLQRLGERTPLLGYVGAVVMVTFATTLWLLRQASQRDAQNWQLWLIALPLLLCVSHLSVALVNWICTLCVPPLLLPKLDFSEGIPPDRRTVCVVPTIITGAQSINDLLEALEVRFLANRDPNLFWALLTDFRDAPQEAMPEDGELLRMARDGVDDLNAKYTSEDAAPFFLFHRPRRWNAQESRWMGWERKRGKLADFNGLLRGSSTDRFTLIVGQTDLLPAIKYVITLDSDTQLPRDAGRQLVGAMAHPLNQPRYDPKRGRVVEGYSILQPRVGVALPSAGRSLFAQLFAGDAGIDPYTRAVSDVYQDVFGEGSFIGKGIYDVDSFEQALKGRFPENRILSHDLLEGCYARAGLISDVILYEEYPSRYTSDISRRHRWIRGDWQIAPWLLPRVPGADGRQVRNPISGLSRWKVFDNLRTQSGAGGDGGGTSVRLASSRSGPISDPRRLVDSRHHGDPGLDRQLPRQASRSFALDSPSRGCTGDGWAARRNGVPGDLSALRGVHRPGCRLSHGMADSRQPAPADGMADRPGSGVQLRQQPDRDCTRHVGSARVGDRGGSQAANRRRRHLSRPLRFSNFGSCHRSWRGG
jgi:hypothetical protein